MNGVMSFLMKNMDYPVPGLSIIMPVRNEADAIGPALAALSDGGAFGCAEVIVVDGDPAGSTIRRIRHPAVRTLLAPAGRGIQMNRGAAMARGRILLFLHVDTVLPADGLPQLLTAMQRPGIAGGAFDLGIDSRAPAYRIITAVASIRSRITRIPYGDQAIFMDRRVFSALGGYRPFPIMEDVDLMSRFKRSGHRLAFIPRCVLTSPRRWERDGIVRGTIRNWALITAYLLGASPHWLARFYR